MSGRFKKSLFCSILLVVVLFSCQTPDNGKRKIFRYNESSGITSLDPIKSNNLANIWATQQVYEGLFMVDSQGLIRPQLAISFSTDSSFTEYKISLRNDVYFHTNKCFSSPKRKFNAQDVAFSLNRLYHSSSGWILSDVEVDSISNELDIQIIDSFNLIISLKYPLGNFIQKLSTPQSAIIPKEAVDYYGDEFRKNPVGTGPFIFHQWYENEKLLLHKNPSYYLRGCPKLDGISISFLKDKQTVLLEFIRGHFDLISGLDAAYKDELLLSDGTLNPIYQSNIYMVKSPYLNTEYLGIRLNAASSSPLQNVHIRKALNAGLDRGKLVKFIRNNVGIPAEGGMIPPVLLPTIKPDYGYAFDLKEFYAEIKASGYSSPGLVPPFTLHADVAYTDVCTFIVNQWNELGLHVRLEILDRPTLKSEVAKGNIEFFRASWIGDYPDMENYLMLFNGPFKSPAGPNYTAIDNLKFNTGFDSLKFTHDYILKQRNASRLDSLVMHTEAPVIILYYDEVVRFLNKRVVGLPNHPMNYLDLRSVSLREN